MMMDVFKQQEATEMKPYLLIACHHYSCGDPEEWVGCYKTYEEAESKMIKVLKPYTYAMSGKLLFKQFYQYENFGIKDLRCDSYKIVDLRKWME
jgi:hypothetical protein